jgi:hypothetical protein
LLDVREAMAAEDLKNARPWLIFNHYKRQQDELRSVLLAAAATAGRMRAPRLQLRALRESAEVTERIARAAVAMGVT